jgi:hypothetical protein
MSSRERYAPAVAQFLAELDGKGLSDTIRTGHTADLKTVSALAALDMVSSCSSRVGEEVWRLRFTKAGRAVRQLLMREAAPA